MRLRVEAFDLPGVVRYLSVRIAEFRGFADAGGMTEETAILTQNTRLLDGGVADSANDR